MTDKVEEILRDHGDTPLNLCVTFRELVEIVRKEVSRELSDKLWNQVRLNLDLKIKAVKDDPE